MSDRVKNSKCYRKITEQEQEELSSKEKLMILAKLIINCCSHEEIDILCTELLHANLMCRKRKRGEIHE